MIIENKNGDQLLEIIDAAEDRVLSDYSPVTHALTALFLYEEGMDIGYINEIDHKLLEYYIN